MNRPIHDRTSYDWKYLLRNSGRIRPQCFDICLRPWHHKFSSENVKHGTRIVNRLHTVVIYLMYLRIGPTAAKLRNVDHSLYTVPYPDPFIDYSALRTIEGVSVRPCNLIRQQDKTPGVPGCLVTTSTRNSPLCCRYDIQRLGLWPLKEFWKK